MDKIILAIGGGSLDSNININKFLVNQAHKDVPNVLFIPIASGDNDVYVQRFIEHFEKLGCNVDVLYLQNQTNDNLIRTKIFRSDIIYIGGGNTAKMMRVFKRTRVNIYLLEAYKRGIIMSGISAGAMAFFKSGYSDSNKMIDSSASLTLVKCLDIIPYCFCPHRNDPERDGFEDFIKEKGIDGLALDDDVALLYKNDEIIGIIGDNRGYIIKDNNRIDLVNYR